MSVIAGQQFRGGKGYKLLQTSQRMRLGSSKVEKLIYIQRSTITTS